MSDQQPDPASPYYNRFRLAWKHWSLGFDNFSTPVCESLINDPGAPIFLKAWSHILLAFVNAEDYAEALIHATLAEDMFRRIVEGPFSGSDKEETFQLIKDLVQYLRDQPDDKAPDLSSIRTSFDGKYLPSL